MKEKNGLYRSFEVKVRAVNEETRTVDVSVSSEIPAYPYRWSDTPEILLHGEENVDLTRLKTVGSVLLNHMPSGPSQPVVIVGRPDNIRIEDRQLRAAVIFDDDEESLKIFRKVAVTKSLRGISVGINPLRVREVQQGEEYEGIVGPAMVATLWEPIEFSFTPIPVDATVGVSRSLSDFDLKSQPPAKENNMKPEEVQALIDAAVAPLRSAIPKAEDIAAAVLRSIAEQSKPRPQVDLDTFKDLRTRAAAHSPECAAKVIELYEQGKTENEMLRAISDMTMSSSDAGDRGGLPNGTGLTNNQRTTETQVLSDKERFFRSLMSPITIQ
jgi:hypothetical protein